jgi:hypothetical protein
MALVQSVAHRGARAAPLGFSECDPAGRLSEQRNEASPLIISPGKHQEGTREEWLEYTTTRLEFHIYWRIELDFTIGSQSACHAGIPRRTAQMNQFKGIFSI